MHPNLINTCTPGGGRSGHSEQSSTGLREVYLLQSLNRPVQHRNHGTTSIRKCNGIVFQFVGAIKSAVPPLVPVFMVPSLP